MTGDDWGLIKELFEGALDRLPGERTLWLAEVCAGRPEIRAEVESLLAAEERAGDFLGEPALAPRSAQGAEGPRNQPEASELLGRSRTGRHAGPYRLIDEIGRGGMGVVYRAERDDDQFCRLVAIKIVGPGLANSEMLRRFVAERQILATLEHPNIARLLDGGVTEDGLPYMAMEYVPGVPITERCAKNRLTVRERLELFQTVCRAVHYAHQHLIVHRDLKPGNILVTGEGVPFLLDFGIAKIMDPLIPAGKATTALFRPMTLEYASPEQLRGAAATTATDLYSLGVILYELLAGEPPFRLGEMGLEEAIRTVTETDPPKPAVRSSLRYSDDLDSIVLRAIRKEPRERYGSAQELCDDIQRYLEGRPVLARRGSFQYVLRKLMVRHKFAVAAAAGALSLAAAGVVAVAIEARVANQQRVKAQRRFDELRGLARSVIFEMHDDIARLAGSTQVRKNLVTRALGYLDSLAKDVAGDAGLEAELAAGYSRLGDVQGSPRMANLGDPAAAMASYRKALQFAHDSLTHEPKNAERLRQIGLLEISIGELEIFRGDKAAARAHLEDALKLLQARAEPSGADQSALATAFLDMYLLLRGTESGKARDYLNQATALYERRLSERPEDNGARNNVALAHRYLSSLSRAEEQPEAALAHLRRSLELDDLRSAADPLSAVAKLDVSTDLAEMGHHLRELNRPAEALPLYRRALVIREDLAAADPSNVLMRTRVAFAYLTVARALFELHDTVGGLENVRKCIAIYAKYTAENPSDTAARGWLLEAYKRTGEAEAQLGRHAAACDAYGKARMVMSTAGHDMAAWAEPSIRRGMKSCCM